MVNILLIALGFIFMEFVAWFSHKYIMHGFLWSWHKDHHRNDFQEYLPEKTEGWKFEKNDLFFITFASPAIILIILGLSLQIWSLIFISIGITLYGFIYFLFHDVAIHKRIDSPIFEKLNKFSYFRAMIKAHRAHHYPKNKSDFNNFGLLIFPLRYFREN
jgi:beta-carotene 3-hydroxylase